MSYCDYTTTASTDYFVRVPTWYVACADTGTRTDLNIILKPKGPEYGWYREFERRQEPDPFRPRLLVAERPYRAQARACVKNARRWKRRRFLQSLRRAA